MQKSAQINAWHHILSNMQGKKMVMVLVFNLSALLVLFATKVQMWWDTKSTPRGIVSCKLVLKTWQMISKLIYVSCNSRRMS
jgi:hypothetical protein